jgi:hypothetical protein
MTQNIHPWVLGSFRREDRDAMTREHRGLALAAVVAGAGGAGLARELAAVALVDRRRLSPGSVGSGSGAVALATARRVRTYALGCDTSAGYRLAGSVLLLRHGDPPLEDQAWPQPDRG